MSRLKRILGTIILTQILMWIGGRIVERRLSSEDVGLNAVNAVSVVGGKQTSFVARGFTGGRARVIMGGVSLDISQCQISQRPAILEVLIYSGGLEIKVPPEWNVRLDSSVTMGGIEDKRDFSQLSENAPVDLVITGKIVFGGLAITS